MEQMIWNDLMQQPFVSWAQAVALTYEFYRDGLRDGARRREEEVIWNLAQSGKSAADIAAALGQREPEALDEMRRILNILEKSPEQCA